MRTYKRLQITGGCYFFTVNLAERQRNDLLIGHIDNLRAAFKQTRNAHSFNIDAIVILPDGDRDYPTRWHLIKSRFSMGIPLDEQISASRQRKGKGDLAAPPLGTLHP